MRVKGMDRWYVVYTQPRSEERALWHLTTQGFRCFLPKFTRLRSHARRKSMILEPLFPRYLFARFDCDMTRWRSINGSRGVVQLLTQGPDPIPVPHGVIEKLVAETDDGGATSLSALGVFWKGRKVRINDGAFAGQVAEIEDLSTNGSLRVKLLLSLLGRTTSVELSACVLEPA
jgi:transcriptional antiterminator RfaH